MGGKSRDQTTSTAPWAPSQPFLMQGMQGASNLVFGQQPAMPQNWTPSFGNGGGQVGGDAVSIATSNGGGEYSGLFGPGGIFSNGQQPGVAGQGGMPLGTGGLASDISPLIREYVGGNRYMKKAFDMADSGGFGGGAYRDAMDATRQIMGKTDVRAQFDDGYAQLRNKLDSQFAAAGRYGADAHQAVLADAGADLMTQLKSENADRRLAAAGQLSGLQDSFTNARNQNIDRLISIGDYKRQLAGERRNWDYDQGMQRLTDYMSLIQGTAGLGGTSTTPQYRNGIAGALGGAVQGAGLGAMLGKTALGPWAVAGGILGVL